VGLSTHYGPSLDIQQLEISQNSIVDNNILGLHLQIQHLTPSHRNLDIQLKIKNTEKLSQSVGQEPFVVHTETTVYGVSNIDVDAFGQGVDILNMSQALHLPSLGAFLNMNAGAHLVGVSMLPNGEEEVERHTNSSGQPEPTLHVGKTIVKNAGLDLLVECPKVSKSTVAMADRANEAVTTAGVGTGNSNSTSSSPKGWCTARRWHCCYVHCVPFVSFALYFLFTILFENPWR
jgi:hypothetical protein